MSSEEKPMISKLLAQNVVSENCFSCFHEFTDYELEMGCRRPVIREPDVYYLCEKCVESAVNCTILLLLIGRS